MMLRDDKPGRLLIKYPDERMISHDETTACFPDSVCSAAGFLFRSTEQIKKDHPELPAYENYDDLFAAIKAVLA